MSTLLSTLRTWGIRLWFACIIYVFFVGAWQTTQTIKAAFGAAHWELAFIPKDR